MCVMIWSLSRSSLSICRCRVMIWSLSLALSPSLSMSSQPWHNNFSKSTTTNTNTAFVQLHSLAIQKKKNKFLLLKKQNLSFINLVSIFRCSSSKTNPVYGRRVNSFVLVLVFHHTDTSLYLLSLALALSIHNKLETESSTSLSETYNTLNSFPCLFSHAFCLSGTWRVLFQEVYQLFLLFIVLAWHVLPSALAFF
jgi:hypothetical protein